ncbi:hypothetical protein [Pseudolysinimonas sp.]|uniref:hypothetical protein n=1 Tax=Pseudolysinimonas sp. TaxID=2680009 RepID=UPI003F80A8C7
MARADHPAGRDYTVAALGPGPNDPPVVIAQVEHHDLTTPAEPSHAPIPDGFDVEAHLLDHAGAYWPWITDVYVEPDGVVTIIPSVDPEYEVIDGPLAGDGHSYTPQQVIDAMRKLVDEDRYGTDYDTGFYIGTLAGEFDDVDGDQNTVDLVLQTLLWGEPIFG